MGLENRIIYGSYIPVISSKINDKNSNFKTFEEIADFSDKIELIEDYKRIQEDFLRDIGVPNDYLDAGASVYLKE